MRIRSIPGAAASAAGLVLRYAAGATAGLSVDWLSFSLAMHLGASAPVAQAAGKLSGSLVGFALYRQVVFRAHHVPPHGQAARFCVAAGAASAIGVGIVGALYAFLPSALCKVCADGVTFSLNFATMRWWVFPADRAVS